MPEAFLQRHGWARAERHALAGDASTRRYTRLTMEGRRAILMESGDVPVDPFLRVQAYLAEIDLSVPAIHAAEVESGLILMEDLGDDTFARLSATSPEQTRILYQAATDLLASLHRQSVPDWADHYDADRMAAFLAPAWEHCTTAEDGSACETAQTIFRDLLHRTDDTQKVLLLRDYHAENLIWLPDRQGIARVGLLDFQDALAGHPAYDLASLLQDARRDVDPTLEDEMITRFCIATNRDETTFRAAYAIQSLQRHARILGIFSKLAVQRNKPGYLTLMPRVRGYMERCLAHPVAEPLRTPLAQTLLKPVTA